MTPTRWAYVWLAVAAAGLITSQPVTTSTGVIVATIWLIVDRFEKRRLG